MVCAVAIVFGVTALRILGLDAQCVFRRKGKGHLFIDLKITSPVGKRYPNATRLQPHGGSRSGESPLKRKRGGGR